MALVSKNIPNLINGVSQQPPALRLSSQGETQENGFSDVVDGLKKRPPTEFKKLLFRDTPDPSVTFQNALTYKLSDTVLKRSFFHTYKRSDSEQFTVQLDPVAKLIRVYDINGNLRYISGQASWDAAGNQITTNNDNTALNDYLQNDFGSAALTRDDIAATSVADYTFFVNKKRKVERDEVNASNSRPYEGLFYLKKADYSKNYVATVLNTSGTKLAAGNRLTSNGSGSSDADSLKTGNIIDGIHTSITTGGTITTFYGTINLPGGLPSPYITKHTDGQPYFIVENPNSDFNITVEDDSGGASFFAHKDAAATFTELPKYCEDGFVIQVNGDNQKKEDDFYVRYTGSKSTGTWKECPAPSRPSNSVYHSFDNATMPHTLRQNDDESFTFGPALDSDGNSWHDRVAGDDATNPFPSFVGSAINDVFFHRNRLGFLSGENVIFSEASSYFNFFRVTVRSLLDSAPIDVAVSQNEVSDLQAAVPTQDNLMLFSGLTQFSLSAEQLLTPAEVSIDQSTKYECDLTAKPVSVGTSIYFTHKDGNFSGVRELFTQGDSDTQDAPSVTSHVPEYISGGVRQLIGSSNEDMLVCLTDDNLHECYVYKWYNSDRERVQSSWSKWIFDEEVVHVAFNNTDIYFIFANASFEKMSLTAASSSVLLDHRVKLTGSEYSQYNGIDFLKTFPNGLDNPSTVFIDSQGAIFTLSKLAEKLANPTDYVYIGEPYTFKYQFSEQIFKPQDDPTRIARYQLRNISLNYNDTGTFDVTVASTGRDPKITNFTGRILSESSNLLGVSPTVEDGTLKVGIQSQAKETDITITNRSHLPSTFQNAEVEAFVTLRNKRI